MRSKRQMFEIRGHGLMSDFRVCFEGLRRFRYLSSSLLSSSQHVPYRITEFATYHNRVRYLYLDAKFKTTPGFQVQRGILPAGVSSNSPSEPTMTQRDGIMG